MIAKTENHTGKKRLEKFVYGLLYPAFFGNMVYDLINIILKQGIKIDGNWNSIFIIDCIIILYTIFDFIHLYADVNAIFNHPELKSGAYLICDTITPLILFVSFVFMKEKITDTGIILFCSTPFIIFIYKASNKKSCIYFLLYFLVSISAGIFSVFKGYKKTPENIYVVFFAILIIYAFYILVYYPFYSRKIDIEKAKKKREKLGLPEYTFS